MENGYSIFWTNHALDELEATYEYLETNFTARELQKLSEAIENITYLISINPHLFQESDIKKGVRKAVVMKFNTLFYRMHNDTIEILSFFSNRQNPSKVKS